MNDDEKLRACFEDWLEWSGHQESDCMSFEWWASEALREEHGIYKTPHHFWIVWCFGYEKSNYSDQVERNSRKGSE